MSGKGKKNKGTKAPPAPELGEFAGVAGDDIGADFVNEIRLTSDEVLRARSSGDVGLYDKVLQDDQVHSTFQQRRLAVISREWYVEPGGDSPGDKAAAEDIEEQLDGIEFDSATYKMLSGVFFGRSIGECMFRANGAHIELERILVRKARRFGFDRENNLRLITRSDPRGKVMPPNKFWVFRAPGNDDDDPHGLGLGHWCYWPAWFKRNTLRFWPLFLQRFAQGTPIAKVPPAMGEPQRMRVARLLDDITTGGKLVIPNNVALELLEIARSSGGDYHLFCSYLDAAIAKIVLSQTMTTDNGSSKSQAEVHNEVKLEVIRSDADLICASFNNGPVAWLTAWNHPGAAVPRVWRSVTAEEDLNKRAERDNKILTLGYEPTQEYIDETYGKGWVKRAAPKSTGVEPGAADFAEGGLPSASAVTKGALEDGWREVVGPEVEAIDQLLADAGSLEVARERLGELAQREPSKLVDSLARLGFSARVGGQLGEEFEDS